MKNAYIDNLQIHDSNNRIGFAIDSYQGLDMPTVRLSSSEKPAADGAIVANQLFGGRAVTIKGRVTADDSATYRSRRRQMLDAITRKMINDEIAPKYFKFKTMDDLELRIPFYTRQFAFDDSNLFAGNYKLDLYSEDHYLESQTLKFEDLYIFTGGGMKIPMDIPMSMANGSSTAAALNNAGNAESKPKIILYGPIQNPVITNQTTGKTMTITYTLTAGQRIEIDVVDETAFYFSSETDTQGDNILQYITGDWVSLTSGNNTIKLVTAVYNTTGYVQFQWRDKYIGS